MDEYVGVNQIIAWTNLPHGVLAGAIVLLELFYGCNWMDSDNFPSKLVILVNSLQHFVEAVEPRTKRDINGMNQILPCDFETKLKKNGMVERKVQA